MAECSLIDWNGKGALLCFAYHDIFVSTAIFYHKFWWTVSTWKKLFEETKMIAGVCIFFVIDRSFLCTLYRPDSVANPTFKSQIMIPRPLASSKSREKHNMVEYSEVHSY